MHDKISQFNSIFNYKNIQFKKLKKAKEDMNNNNNIE